MDNYRNLLLAMKSFGRTFGSFSCPTEKCFLLRVDVDYDLKWASELAKLHKEFGVNATFFIQVGSPFYNFLSPDGCSAVQTIMDSDQRIGLHFNQTGKVLDVARLKKEYHILSTIVSSAEKVVAWHNPDAWLPQLNNAAEQEGFLSTYSDPFFGTDRYISDSNFRNSPDTIIQFIASNRASLIQVLIHPFNWVLGGDTIEEVLGHSFESKVRCLVKEYSANAVWRDRGDEKMLKHFSLKKSIE